ncbi:MULTISPECIES: RAxF-45 family protein [Brevibacillus]|uniref:RAxF-45 family protein n=1 Tax=Brevibacillus TaxID=55080 RepID=UPI0016067572|nr:MULTISPECIES: RAxF-45 family protein [Brevibacillus]MCM3079066.1 hypothetical protein [Brevibacillus invocatus]MCM3429871.1 hypothetical protein [Brevibacillus invocatus]MDH4617066.1 hypothetical protein [Brevibacillus sp. AY1]
MVGAVHAWFVVETTSMTHDFTVNGISLPFFNQTTERKTRGVPTIDRGELVSAS